MNSSTSYIGKEHSIWIKGILTILIVLGHNMIFTIPLREHGAMSFLYLFHIQVFFILPFLYGIDKQPYTKSRFKNTIIRFFWPYLLLVTLFAFSYNIATSDSQFSIQALLRLYVFCDSTTIRQMCGVQIFWFLPSMMCLVLLKELYYRNNLLVRCLLLFLSLTFIGLTIYSRTSYVAYSSWSNILQCIPLGGGYAVSLLVLGVVSRCIVAQIVRHKWYLETALICTICFAVCSGIYWSFVAKFMSSNPVNMLYVILQQIMPVIFLLILIAYFNLFKFKRSGYIERIGTYSLLIYLISPFIGYITTFIATRLHIMYWWVGLLIWPVIVFVSYQIARGFSNSDFVNILIPHNVDIFRQTFHKIKERYF